MQARRTLKIDNLPIDTEPAVLTLFLQHFLAEDLTKSMTNVHTVRIGDRFSVGYATLASCADVHKAIAALEFVKRASPPNACVLSFSIHRLEWGAKLRCTKAKAENEDDLRSLATLAQECAMYALRES